MKSTTSGQRLFTGDQVPMRPQLSVLISVERVIQRILGCSARLFYSLNLYNTIATGTQYRVSNQKQHLHGCWI